MRETIYAALFDLLTPLVTAGTMKTARRRLEFAEEVDTSLLPGVWQNQVEEIPAKYASTGVACWYFDVNWYIYDFNNDETAPSSPAMNANCDAVLGVLPRDDAGEIKGLLRVTVDGVDLVCTLSLREPVRYWEGLLNNKNVVQVPIRILVPTGG